MSSLETSRVWLVTGTSSGIGRSLVEVLLAAGDRVVATTRKASSLSSLTAAFSAEKLLVLELDLSSNDDVIAAFQKIKTHFGRCDVVVNNAGYGLSGEIEAITDEQAKDQFEVNFWGPVRICREAVRFFREDNPAKAGGRILNISSAGGFSGNPTLAFYSASKFALEGFSESLSKELPSEWNIKVTIIEPGGVRTDWNKGSMVRVASHPAYTGAQAPSTLFRHMVDDLESTNDPVNAARAIIAVSNVEDPPLRLPLGPDSLHVVRFKCETVLKDAKDWEALSMSTLADDSNPDFISKLGPATLRK